MKEKQQLLFRNSGSTGSDWLVAGTLDEFLQNGVYLIKMLNADGTLGLPFSVTNDDVVKLVVSDSGANGRQQSGRAVVQTITFARSGSAKSITYTRTRRNVNGNHQWSSWVEPEAASTANIYDGSVTAEKLSDDIRPNAVSPLRPLFIAAGAEYNDTTVDKTKTAPWGETVIHKAGHYYLNGLGDITEGQMIAIYNAPYNIKNQGAYEGQKIRTAFFYPDYGWCPYNLSLLFSNSEIEVLGTFVNRWGAKVETLNATDVSYMFLNCSKLRYCNLIIACSTNLTGVVQGCANLELFRIKGVKSNLTLSACPKISKESVLYIIQNASPVSAITIALHPDAYARLADDTYIVAALEAQPLVSLVCA